MLKKATMSRETNPVSDSKWHFWVDRGGTFTDVVARAPDGELITHKLLSENPSRYQDAALQGIRDLLQIPADAPIPTERIACVKVGTTLATNALLERTGEPCVLVTTKGFRDALRIAYQNRPKLFALRIELSELLYDQVIEIDERVGSDGTVYRALDSAGARAALEAAFSQGIRAAAIVFMHGYRYTDHEKQVAALARDIGFTQVSASHEVSPLMKLVGRGDTTVVDVYLSPLLRRYVEQLRSELKDTPLYFMQSNGGLADAAYFMGKDAILSGPAGGIVGAVRTAEKAGFEQIIGFDMGGTSTDVTHYAGAYERSFDTEVAGVRLRVPMMHIHTVAAGGGSKLVFDGARFRVGPESAGAYPGPACYRNCGPLAVTDCHVMLGRISPAYFPHVFGSNGDKPLDADTVARKFAELAQNISTATGKDQTPEQVAEGFLAVAVENMARAIKKISTERGYDVSRYTLVCFGGAGGQHACRVADRLGMTRIMVHPLAGVLSAFGMGLADLRVFHEQAIEAELEPGLLPRLEDEISRLCEQGYRSLQAQGVPRDRARATKTLLVRYRGSDTPLPVGDGTEAEIRLGFEAAHRQLYGFTEPGKSLIVEAISVEVAGGGAEITMPGGNLVSEKAAITTRVFVDGEYRHVPVFQRESLAPGEKVLGPAIILEPHGTNIVEPGWEVAITANLDLILDRVLPLKRGFAVGTEADPVMLEIFNNRFMSIAEQMGVVLERTAHSVNIKERLDFSCAVFDRQGHLIANAPHIPVHLGSLGLSVQTIVERNRGQLAPGDVYLLNDPYHGGTHLPDLTVVGPVFDEGGGEPILFVAARGHHADVGGISPGSMPPFSKSLDEEGILFDNFKLVAAGRFREAEVREKLAAGPYPARNPDQNVADLKAQVAANEMGARELNNMVAQFGLETVHAYMAHVQSNAEEAVRRVIDALSDGSFSLPLDNGAIIRVKITVDRRRRAARIDFTGTSAQLADNFNAPRAIGVAAVLYVFRCLVADDIPLNEGCLAPLEIIVPEGSMLNPKYPAPVVAGNVESSQCIVNALFGAMGVMAAAQGTMNNFTFGNERWQYYETIAGGTGAGHDFDGASGVQSHMTNSRLTDPEVLEVRFPVLLERFEIRRGSGGSGRHKGGDGIVRQIRFLEPMQAAILSNFRTQAPFGLEGGALGKPGENRVERADGRIELLNSCDEVDLSAGDRFVIETPGGGGFGHEEPHGMP